MAPYKYTDRSALLDKLVEYLNRYLKIRSEGGKKEDFTHCQETLRLLVSRIKDNNKTGQIQDRRNQNRR